MTTLEKNRQSVVGRTSRHPKLGYVTILSIDDSGCKIQSNETNKVYKVSEHFAAFLYK